MNARKILPLLLAAVLFLAGCSPIRFLGEDETMLHKVRITSDDKQVDKSKLG